MHDAASARAAIDRIAQSNLEYYSDRRGAGVLKLLQQTFPSPWQYVAELLQNAVDEGARHIRIATSEGGL